MRKHFHWASLVVFLLSMTASVHGETFRSIYPDIKVGNVLQTDPVTIPYIVWGGDMATFYANGGKTTESNTLFKNLGLNIKLTPGDDFKQQVQDYMSGKSPFLRGTFHMIGMASDVIGSDPRTRGVVILQMTWSSGDHLVARKEIKTVNDLKGKTIAIQKWGPHVGMLDDILKTANLKWTDVKIRWAADLTGSADSPAELFRNSSDIDACFVITPDMIGLCGGLQSFGTGAEGTVKGARVLVSTAEMSRSIADVYVCRKDFYDTHKDFVTKFVAGYLKACEEVVELKNQYESKGSPNYLKLLQLTQDIYGKDVIPTLEEDAHGLLQDCTFVGYPGNVLFFTQKQNLSGFDEFQKSTLDMAQNLGFIQSRKELSPSGLDYNAAQFTQYLTKTKVEQSDAFRGEAVAKEIEALSSGGGLDDRTIASFTINFEPNQNRFSVEQYGTEYQRVVEMANKFGNAVIAIRGHSDPAKTLLDLVQAGIGKGILKRSGSSGDYRYSFKGKPLDLTATAAIIKLIESGEFEGVPDISPIQTMQAALNLSKERADAVRTSIIEYAQSKGYRIDASQIQSVGVGIREPFIAKPANLDEARQNMRVEFRLIRVNAEASTKKDFDF